MFMSALNQKTIKNTISINGVGLHTGKEVSLKIKPAVPNTGIIFRRIDKEKYFDVIPNIYNVSDANFCTTISNDQGVKVSTIEHLMAAFYIAGIDNVIVELNSQEVPIMDGSAKDYIELSKIYENIFISNINLLGEQDLDMARRFINMIDEFYDRNVKVVISAQEHIDKICSIKSISKDFERTISRIKEMQSHEYIAKEHKQ